MGSRFLVGLDIGTASVRAVVVEYKSGRPIIRRVFKEASRGVRRGIVVDAGETALVVARALEMARGVARAAPKNVYVNIGTHNVRAVQQRGIVAVSRADNEIYQDDIDRAIKASQAMNLPPNRTIIHNVTREFIVDGVGDIPNPLGLSGNRLEVNSLVIDVFEPHLKGIMKVVELAGGRISGLLLNPLVAARSTLSKSQRDLGVVLLDIGMGTTSFAVYEENKVLAVGVLPIGGGNITNDIAVGLKVPVDVAEPIKVRYGHAVSSGVSRKDTVSLTELWPEGREAEVSRKFVAEIVEARLAEICDFIGGELKRLGRAGQLAGGVVLVGGTAKLPGLSELVRRELKLFSQIGCTIKEEWDYEASEVQDVFEDPEFVTAMGLVLKGAEQEEWYSIEGGVHSPVDALRRAIRYFAP